MTSIFKCDVPGCHHEGEWCNNRRNRCDALVKVGGVVTFCGRLPTWLAPTNDHRFPLAYCGTHRPPDTYKREGPPMSNPSKQKGTKAEGQAVLFLRRWWPRAERRALSGSQDKGDVSGTSPFVIEVKAHKSWRIFAWLDELKQEQKHAGEPYGIILARRPNHKGFVAVMPEETLAYLLDCINGVQEGA